MFSIERRSNLRFRAPEFVCDRPIHRQVEPPLPNCPFFMAIVGSAGSGKTSLMVNMLTSKQAYKKAFDYVHVVMPAHSVASLKKNIFEMHPRMHDELTLGVLHGILERVKQSAEHKESSLLILDDVTASLKDKQVQQLLKQVIFNRRHYRLSIVMLLQSYNACPLPVRKTLSHCALFKPRNKKEYAAVFEELLFMDKDAADALHNFVYDEPYSFLFVDVNTNSLFKKFDTIVVHGGHASQPEGQVKGEAQGKGHHH